MSRAHHSVSISDAWSIFTGAETQKFRNSDEWTWIAARTGNSVYFICFRAPEGLVKERVKLLNAQCEVFSECPILGLHAGGRGRQTSVVAKSEISWFPELPGCVSYLDWDVLREREPIVKVVAVRLDRFHCDELPPASNIEAFLRRFDRVGNGRFINFYTEGRAAEVVNKLLCKKGHYGNLKVVSGFDASIGFSLPSEEEEAEEQKAKQAKGKQKGRKSSLFLKWTGSCDYDLWSIVNWRYWKESPMTRWPETLIGQGIAAFAIRKRYGFKLLLRGRSKYRPGNRYDYNRWSSTPSHDKIEPNALLFAERWNTIQRNLVNRSEKLTAAWAVELYLWVCAYLKARGISFPKHRTYSRLLKSHRLLEALVPKETPSAAYKAWRQLRQRLNAHPTKSMKSVVEKSRFKRDAKLRLDAYLRDAKHKVALLQERMRSAEKRYLEKNKEPELEEEFEKLEEELEMKLEEAVPVDGDKAEK